MKTLLLDRSNVAQRLEGLSLLQALREGFTRAGGENAPAPAFTVTEVGSADGGLWLVEHAGEPAPRCILRAGQLRRLMEALIGALAVDTLARKDATRVALLGASDAAAAQLKSLRLVRTVSHLRIFDEDRHRCEQLANRLHLELSLPVRMARAPDEAVADADVVVVTAATSPAVLFPGMLPEGTHVNCAPRGESGLSGQLLEQSTSVSADALALVLAGRARGRVARADVTVFCSDVPVFARAAAAELILSQTTEDPDLVAFDFEG